MRGPDGCGRLELAVAKVCAPAAMEDPTFRAGPPAGPAGFGALLRRCRALAGLSQEALAERAGLSARGISDLERGLRRWPQAATLRRLVASLGLPPDRAAALAAAAARPRRADRGRPRPERAGERAPRRAAPAQGRSSSPPARTNLPAPLTGFVGRRRARAEVAALLRRSRLVTLTGPGGVGKTRLALEVAAGRVGALPGGVWLADLGPLVDPDLVPQTVAATLGVRDEPGDAVAAVLAAVRHRRLLLVLDNCEHLLDACARLADALLRDARGVRVLATSRAPLGVAGETVWRVAPLVPPAAGESRPVALAGNEAVRLFVERARAARPGFALRPENARAVADVCRRLDGIPLALELAAARLRVLPVGDLLARLDDRFGVLVGGSRTALPRHQTLAATVDWSYGLLTESERVAFRRLAVFAGGWSLAAAEQVVADPPGLSADRILDVLSRLVDCSLVVAGEDDAGHARFGMLETLRAYALARPEAGGAALAVRHRHLAHYAALAEAAEPELGGPDQGRWLALLEREYANCRAALRWALASPEPAAAERGLGLAGALGEFWLRSGRLREARTWLDALLAAPAARAPSPTRAKALSWAGMVAGFLGDSAAGRARRDECAALVRELGDPNGLGVPLRLLGHLAMHFGRPAEAVAWLTETAAHFRRVNDQTGLASALQALGQLARFEGDCDAARRAYEGSLAIYRRLGDRTRVATVLHRLGYALRTAGDAAGSRGYHEEALTIWRELGYENGIAGALNALGEVALAAGEHAHAAALFVEAGERFGALESGHGQAVVLQNLGLVARAVGDRPAARTRLRAALRAWRDLGAEHRIAEALETLAGLAVQDGQAAPALRLAGAAAAVRAAGGPPARGPRCRRPRSPVRAGPAGPGSPRGRRGARARARAVAGTGRRPGARRSARPGLRSRRRQSSGRGRPRAPDRTGRRSGPRRRPAVGPSGGVRGGRDGRPGAGRGGAPPGRGQRSPRGPRDSPLTPREDEVAALVVQGLTDRQIAARLLFTERTAGTHLERIMHKLGVHSRAEVAAWVVGRRPAAGVAGATDGAG